MKTLVTLRGCDGSTSFYIETTFEQLEFLTVLAAESRRASTYGCMPKMVIDDMTYAPRTEDMEDE